LSRRLSCDAVNPDNEVIEQVAEALTDGQTVVMPTETQYALSIRASVDDALEKICRIKQRKEGLSIALFVQDMQMAERFCDISDVAKKLADRFLPGPLTLVLPGKKGQTAVAAGFLSPLGFGIRVSSSPIVKAVMGQIAFPVTATSANISGQSSPSHYKEIDDVIINSVDY
jgi:L-threonylcarbamoyladenylate synthase